MLLMVARKLWNNKWMFLCLLLGAVLAVGMVGSIPTYTDGVLNRMLKRDLELYQERTGAYPGRFTYTANISSFTAAKRENNFNYFDLNLAEKSREVPVPIVGKTTTVTLSWLRAKLENTNSEDSLFVKIAAMKYLEDHVTLVSGELPSNKIVDGVYEVMLSRQLMQTSDYTLGQVYDLADTRKAKQEGKDRVYPYTMKMKIVGVYDILPSDTTYFYDLGRTTREYLMMNYDLCIESFLQIEEPFVFSATWAVSYDYHSLNIANLAQSIDVVNANMEWLKAFYSGPAAFPSMTTLENYNNREMRLRTTLTVMQAPILVMLAFYIFMVTRLIIGSERNEIAALKSRGASGLQVLLIYLLEAIVVVGAALPIGVALGYFICTVLGASNGFLEFVSRKALPIEVTRGTIEYSLICAVFLVVTMLLPALSASRVTIVEKKRAKPGIALWKKLGADVLLIALAGYGWYSYNMRQITLEISGATASDVPVDPLLFIISTLFIMGAGLFFLRFYPLIIRAVYQLGKKFWSPALYASFLQVGRSGGQETFVMLFLIITISLGIFSANSARTINLNVEDKIMYAAGADIVMVPTWRSNEVVPDPEAESASTSKVDSSAAGYGNSRYITYIEPPFSLYENLDGVERAAKVFVKTDAAARVAGRGGGNANLMAIEPSVFGEVAHMPDDLLKPHFNVYLNLLAKNPQAALISRKLAEHLQVEPGDAFSVTWSDQNHVNLTVYAIVDYWPTHNYLEKTSQNLIVMNLSTAQKVTAIEPYQIWYKKAADATSAQVYADIAEKKINYDKLTDSGQMLVEAKNDPMLQGTNGALTMAFIVTMTVSFVGFVIYWVLSIRGRELQFGILRAMGMSMRSIIGMLLWEQLLISGTAILAGILLGGATAKIFTPLLQLVTDATEQIPPFRVVASREDYVKIYAVLGAMIGIGFISLGALISRIRIAQALKLGED